LDRAAVQIIIHDVACENPVDFYRFGGVHWGKVSHYGHQPCNLFSQRFKNFLSTYHNSGIAGLIIASRN